MLAWMPPTGLGAVVAIGGNTTEPDELDVDFSLDSETLSPPNGVGAFEDIGGNAAEDDFVLSDLSGVVS
jgi:hypothetical protein